MKRVNPFKPTAGAEPPVLIGRSQVIEDFTDGIEEGVGSPARLMRITGPRGSGKTVLLTELGDIARKRGWVVVDETAGPGLVERVIASLSGARRHVDVSAKADAFGFGGELSVSADQREKTLREVLTRAATRLVGKDKGVLVTIDEAQDADEDDMRAIAAAVQHLIREKKNVAFVFAGITTGVLDMLNGKALTFLRRAKAEELGPIPLDQVAQALRHTIEKSGLQIDDEALDVTTQATAGYAYLIQLVGYHVWRAGKNGESPDSISVADAQRGIEQANREFISTVLETALSDLPLRSMEYLLAMAQDDGASSTAEVARRIGVKASSVTSYRRMLIKRQVIEATARGFVDFSIPHMREYLRDSSDELLARYGR